MLQSNENWDALIKYKRLNDRLNELKLRAWLDLPPSQDIQLAIEEAEIELEKYKAWIDFNFKQNKAD